MSTSATESAIRKSVVVSLPVERAFALFTDELATWWPLASHSIGGDETESAFFEGREGGRVYERRRDGTEGQWATVLVWQPPHRFVLEWKVNPKASAPTEVEVRFAPDGAGTRVDLEHRGWERRGDAEQERSSYDSGWDFVLGEFVRSSP